jgi:hypothetical protein
MAGVTNAVACGIDYLLAKQCADGHWEDYALPTGQSDAWITAFVGMMLAGIAAQSANAEVVAAAARRGAGWLIRHRPYPAGWGYNDTTGPDSDSTAYALLLLRTTGCAVRCEDEAWLLERWLPDDGFATYAGPGGWGMAHPDVTPVAFAALSAATQARLRGSLVRALQASRDADGTWPSYWWRTRHYSTYLNARLARALPLGLAPGPPVVLPATDRAVHSAFDLAFVTANALLYDAHAPACDQLAQTMLALQQPQGHWQGSANLRVMRHDAEDPWQHPEGELYVDREHLITTASAVHVLSQVQARCATHQ